MVSKFLSSYGFNGIRDFALSMFPSFKYGQGREALGLSAIIAFIAKIMGITPLVVVAMFVVVLVESVTGIGASNKQGKPFESWRFSRCIIKVSIWVSLFFMFNAFKLDAEVKDGVLWQFAVFIYTLMQITTMIYFVVEYATSIAENLAILDGKDKDAYIKAIKELFGNIIKSFNKKID